MSGAGSQLTAKLVLTADAKGVVGAGTQAKAALKDVATAARDTGKAGVEMAAGIATGTDALTVMTREQAGVTRGLTATGEARKVEMALLSQQAAKAGVVTASISAMSAAHATYNATVSDAKALLDAGLIGQDKYRAAVTAASTALALATAKTVDLGTNTAKGAVEVERIEKLMARLGETSGIAGGQVGLVKDAIRAIPTIVTNFPVTSALIAVAAAAGIALAAEQKYESSVREISIAVQAHANYLGLTRDEYAALADQITTTASVSQREGNKIAAGLVTGNLSPKSWNDLSAAAAGYARVIGSDVPEAVARLQQSATDQSAFDQLNSQYHFVNDAQDQFIRRLDESGDHMGAAALRSDILKKAFADQKDQVGLVSGAYETASKKLSDFFYGMGSGLAKVAAFTSAVPQLVKGGDPRAFGFAAAAIFNPPTPQLPSGNVPVTQAQKNQESTDVGNILRGASPFQSQLLDNAAQQKAVLKAYSDGAIDAATKTQALTALQQKNKEITKAQQDAYLNLHEALKQHLEQVKSLIAGGPEVLAQAKAQADAAVAQAGVAGQSTLAQQKLNDAFEIQKATLPYVTALIGTHGAAAKKLQDIIDGLTASMTKNQTATHYSDAVTDIQNQLTSIASGSGASLALINMQLDENARRLTDWKNTSIAALKERGASAQQLAAVDAIYDAKEAQLLEDDLARRKDWASGTKRALTDLSRATEDWATTSANLTKATSQEFQTDFVDSIIRQKDPLQAFFSWYLEQLLNVIYQQKLASSFNAVAGGLTNFVGSLLGLGSSPVTPTVTVSENNNPFGVHHAGGSARSPSVTRDIDVSAIGNLPRFHTGTGGLNVGEVLAVLKDDEYVQTAEDRQREMQRTAQPIVYNGGGGASSAPPQIIINNNHPDAQVSKGNTTRGANGQWQQEILISKLEGQIADNIARGASPIGTTMEHTYNLKRGTGG